jgi:hypothetical protein
MQNYSLVYSQSYVSFKHPFPWQVTTSQCAPGSCVKYFQSLCCVPQHHLTKGQGLGQQLSHYSDQGTATTPREQGFHSWLRPMFSPSPECSDRGSPPTRRRRFVLCVSVRHLVSTLVNCLRCSAWDSSSRWFWEPWFESRPGYELSCRLLFDSAIPRPSCHKLQCCRVADNAIK